MQVILLLCLILLSGCVSTFSHPYKGQADFDTNNAQCEYEGLLCPISDVQSG